MCKCPVETYRNSMEGHVRYQGHESMYSVTVEVVNEYG